MRMQRSLPAMPFQMLLLLVVAAAVQECVGQLPYYEPERARFQFFPSTTGSSNVTAFSEWVVKEDWSFDNPFDVVNVTSVVNFATGATATRPNVSLALNGLLKGGDVDVILINKTDKKVWEILYYVAVPGCLEYEKVMPALSLLAPKDSRDAKTAQRLVDDPAGDEPFEIPKGYGVYTVYQNLSNAAIATRYPRPFVDPAVPTPSSSSSSPSPSPSNVNDTVQQTGFTPELQHDPWWMPSNFTEKCRSKPRTSGCFAELKSWAIFNYIDTPGLYWLAVWMKGTEYKKPVDYTLLGGGTEGDYRSSDFARVAAQAPFVSNGKTIHIEQCTQPPGKP